MSTLADIKAAIEELSEEERAALARWLAEVDQQAWNAQISQDSSPDGCGIRSLKEVDERIDRGDFTRLG